MQNVNDSFFQGYYKEIWRALIPEELTAKETDFMLSFFSLKPGNRVLDLMCGYGRHSLALARRGIAVTAVDNLSDYTAEIIRMAEAEQLPVTVYGETVQAFQTEERFDLAICMGNSVNFLSREEVLQVLRRTSAQLKEGGSLLINLWTLAEIVYRQFQEKSWSEINGHIFLTDSVLRFQPARMETNSLVIAPDGSREIKQGVDYIFSINEWTELLRETGFLLQEVYSIPGKKLFSAGDPRAYLVARRPD